MDSVQEERAQGMQGSQVSHDPSHFNQTSQWQSSQVEFSARDNISFSNSKQQISFISQRSPNHTFSVLKHMGNRDSEQTDLLQEVLSQIKQLQIQELNFSNQKIKQEQEKQMAIQQSRYDKELRSVAECMDQIKSIYKQHPHFTLRQACIMLTVRRVDEINRQYRDTKQKLTQQFKEYEQQMIEGCLKSVCQQEREREGMERGAV